MVQIRCSQCGADVSLPDSSVGADARCPRCSQPIAMPTVTSIVPGPQQSAVGSRPRWWPAALHACAYSILTAIAVAGWFLPVGPEMVGPAYVRNQYHDVLTANRVQVVDGKGDVRVMLSGSEEGGSVKIFDKMGARFIVQMDGDTVTETLFDTGFQSRVSSTVDAAGEPKVLLTFPGGNRRVEVK
jgi:DNA-directed RNA polymerase subunit RPC12/RpoP